jgi:integrase/recombinase XerD
VLSFSKALQGFKFSNQIRNLSPRTITWYDFELAAFEKFLLTRFPGKNAASLNLQEISRADVEAFISSLQERETQYTNHTYRAPIAKKLSAFTVKTRVRALHRLFTWATREKFITGNPMDEIAMPKVPKSFKPRFSEDEIRRLLKTCEGHKPLDVRNRAVILFLLDTGIRASELCTLTLDRVDEQFGRAHITGKGMKDRYVVCGARTRQALWEYVNVCRPAPKDTNALFLTAYGRPLNANKLQHILRAIGKRAGVVPTGPHRFRHTSARLYLRNGGDVASLQLMLGHSDLSTTSVYSRMETEDLEKTHARVSPVDRLGL